MGTSLATTAAVTGTVGGFLALAGTPDNGVIYACYSKHTGDLRVVKSGANCSKQEIFLSWNAKGPQGKMGKAGAPGVPGTPGARARRVLKVLTELRAPRVRKGRRDLLCLVQPARRALRGRQPHKELRAPRVRRVRRGSKAFKVPLAQTVLKEFQEP